MRIEEDWTIENRTGQKVQTNGIGVVDVVVGAVGSTPATSGEKKYSEKSLQGERGMD